MHFVWAGVFILNMFVYVGSMCNIGLYVCAVAQIPILIVKKFSQLAKNHMEESQYQSPTLNSPALLTTKGYLGNRHLW